MKSAAHQQDQLLHEREVAIGSGKVVLTGNLSLPEGASGLVLFAHGSGSSRHSRRNRYVSHELQQRGLGTLLFDLLSQEEEIVDQRTMELRFDIGLLARRLIDVTGWARSNDETRHLTIGYFGASTGAAAALVAAAELGNEIGAVVSRGGRPDLAGSHLAHVSAPTLLIVGGEDTQVIALNQHALGRLHCFKELVIIPHATHLFEEPGALEQVSELAGQWFARYLQRST